jgi:cytochrome c556
MNTHFNRIMAMSEGKVPFDAKLMADNALIVESISRLPWQAFGPGTDKGEETNAKPEVWKEAARFKTASESLMNETTKLAAAARSGNLDAIKSAAAATAKSCKSCHDHFVDE